MNVSDLQDKTVAVYGFGIEGQSAVDYLKPYARKITVFDRKKDPARTSVDVPTYQADGVEFRFGQEPETLSGFDMVIRSPGVHPNTTVLDTARTSGIAVTSTMQLFFTVCPCPVVGVTGTKGKGTTASLIYEMLRSQGRDAYLGGNIGVSPLTFLPALRKTSVAVLELSSFQLMDMTMSPHIAVVLMVTEEHMDYHKNHDEYRKAKQRILRFQTNRDYAVINTDHAGSASLVRAARGNVLEISTQRKVRTGVSAYEGQLVLFGDGVSQPIIDLSRIFLPGRHNWENAAAACGAAAVLGVPADVMQRTLTTFRGLPHRLELVGEYKGVRYYNDSFSTTPETAIAAIRAFDAPKVLILGGSSKKSDFSELGKVITESGSIRGIVGIGEEWHAIKSNIKYTISNIIEGKKTMEEVVEAARSMAKPGDVVILTPACASFDMFQDYKDRGEQFRKYISEFGK